MFCSASFVSGASGSVQHPFGSFRHEGSFPSSMISGSVTSRHLLAPQPSENTSDFKISQNSTHIYVNTMDYSDCGNIKSTKFWNDDANTTDDDDTIADDASSTSEFSSIHSGDHMPEILDDHRGNMDFDLCYPSYQYATSFTPRDMAPCPVQVSVSNRRVLCSKPPIAPRLDKCTLSASASVNSKVGPWLKQLRVLSSDVNTPSSTSGYRPYEQSSGNQNTHDSDVSPASESTHTETTFDSVPTSTPAWSVLPIDSDTSSFMQRPMCVFGVTHRKNIISTRHKFTRKLRKLFTRSDKVLR